MNSAKEIGPRSAIRRKRIALNSLFSGSSMCAIIAQFSPPTADNQRQGFPVGVFILASCTVISVFDLCSLNLHGFRRIDEKKGI